MSPSTSVRSTGLHSAVVGSQLWTVRSFSSITVSCPFGAHWTTQEGRCREARLLAGVELDECERLLARHLVPHAEVAAVRAEEPVVVASGGDRTDDAPIGRLVHGP